MLDLHIWHFKLLILARSSGFVICACFCYDHTTVVLSFSFMLLEIPLSVSAVKCDCTSLILSTYTIYKYCPFLGQLGFPIKGIPSADQGWWYCMMKNDNSNKMKNEIYVYLIKASSFKTNWKSLLMKLIHYLETRGRFIQAFKQLFISYISISLYDIFIFLLN